MLNLSLVPVVAMLFWAIGAYAAGSPTTRNVTTEKTRDGALIIEPINHSALRFEFKGKQYYVDPAGQADWARCPRPTPSSSPMSIATTLR